MNDGINSKGRCTASRTMLNFNFNQRKQLRNKDKDALKNLETKSA